MSKSDEPDTRSIWEGNIVLYTQLVRGKLNPIWQAKITTASGKGRIRISTKSRSFNEAKRIDSAHHADGGHVRDYRMLFRLYCLTIYYSGIRPGKEMASLRWSSVEYVRDEYVLLKVETSKQKNGDFKQRTVVALSYLKDHIEEVRSVGRLHKNDKHIFVHPSTTQLDKSYIGKPIVSFKTQWTNFIRWAGLELESTGKEKRRTLYSLRHLYFEQRLINSDVGLYELAKNGGTSVQVIERRRLVRCRESNYQDCD